MSDSPNDGLLSLREFQALLINNGYDMPKYGADGLYGAETEAAFEKWGRSDESLRYDVDVTPAPTPPSDESIVPADWMPDCRMDRIILHWTAGANKASDHDRDYYHILINADSTLVRGKKSIKDNVSTSDGVYAAHTSQYNTYSIGISLCGMAGAEESPFYAGTSPINESQYMTAARVAAELARKYDIPNDKNHILSHGRVQANNGVPQSGKWDVCEVPWDRSIHGEAVDEMFRQEVAAWL
jgi:peptidoglycan hydrolase-like protein with peptidoglycan-binding domain